MEEHVTHVPVHPKRGILRGGTLIEGLLQYSGELLEVLEALLITNNSIIRFLSK
jgi:hypothetical protein